MLIWADTCLIDYPLSVRERGTLVSAHTLLAAAVWCPPLSATDYNWVRVCFTASSLHLEARCGFVFGSLRARDAALQAGTQAQSLCSAEVSKKRTRWQALVCLAHAGSRSTYLERKKNTIYYFQVTDTCKPYRTDMKVNISSVHTSILY